MYLRLVVSLSLLLTVVQPLMPGSELRHPSLVTGTEQRDLAHVEPHGLALSDTEVTSWLFIENVGQFDERARFQVRGVDQMLWLAEDAIWLTVLDAQSDGNAPGKSSPFQPVGTSATDSSAGGVNIRLSFVDANPHPRIEAFGRVSLPVSFFEGDSQSDWHVAVPVWAGVRYADLYPGIDLEMTIEHGQISQRLVAQPEADLNTVRLRVEGADRLWIESGSLRLGTSIGEVAYPLITLAESSMSSGSAPLVVGSQVYRPFGQPAVDRQPLHPQSPQGSTDLQFSTFLGGSLSDRVEGEALDAAGNIFVIGETWSIGFPTTAGVFDRSLNGNSDVFVAKLNGSGTGLLYATFIGGSGSDCTMYCDLTVDANGLAYLTGTTWSSNFPTTTSAYDRYYSGSYDAFITKLNSTGTGLVYSTYLGGSYGDYAVSVAVDNSGAAYIAGYTDSSNFPTTWWAYDGYYNGGTDAFVTKLNASGTALTYSTFLGGWGWDSAHNLVVRNDEVYVVGAAANGFPVTYDAYDQSFAGCEADYPWCDAFVAHLNSGGSGLVYATYLGGTGADWANSIDVDENGAVAVSGLTTSTNFPHSSNGFDYTFNGATDSFIVQLNSTGSTLSYGSYFGGNGFDYANNVRLDRSGAIYIAGGTNSTDLPTTGNAFDRTANNADAMIAKFTPAGALLYSTYLGGSSYDWITFGFSLDASSNVYVAGGTYSPDFPTTPGAYDRYYNGEEDAFVAKLVTGGYTAAGQVVDLNGNPVAGVLVRAGNGLGATTGIDGRYLISGLPAGTFTLTPALTDHTFTPCPRTVNVPPSIANQNFVASSASLSGPIAQFASDTQARLGETLTHASTLAEDGDFFAIARRSDEIQWVAEAVVDSIGVLATGFDLVGVDAIQKLTDATKIQAPGWIGRTWKHVIELRDKYEPARNLFRETLFKPLSSANLKLAAKEFMNGAHIFYAADALDQAGESLVTDNLIKYGLQVGLQSDLALESELYPGLERLDDVFQQDLLDTADNARLNLSCLSASEQTLYATDLNKRNQANLMLNFALQWRGLPVHLARMAREGQDDNWLRDFVVEYLAKGAAFLIADGFGVLAVEGTLLLTHLYQNGQNVKEDVQMMTMAVEGLSGAISTQQRIYLNAVNGLDSIATRTAPQIANGSVGSITHHSVGEYRLFGRWWWWERESYSDVNVSNNTSYRTTYQILADYGNTGFMGLSYQPLLEEGVTAIAGNQAGTVRLHYKQPDQGASPDDDSAITMRLLGSTDTGTYWILNTGSTWQPSRITTAGRPATLPNGAMTTQAISPTLPYPIRSRVDVLADQLEYLPHAWVSNPFTQTVSVTITQPIPTGAQIIDANGGLLDGTNLVWSRTISPETTIEITHLIRLDGAVGANVIYPPAQLTLADQVDSADFVSNEAAFQILSPLVGSGLPPQQIYIHRSTVVPITITNRAANTLIGTVRLTLQSLAGVQAYLTTQVVQVPAGGNLSISLPLQSPPASGDYVITALVESGGGSAEIFQAYFQVIDFKTFLPIVVR